MAELPEKAKRPTSLSKTQTPANLQFNQKPANTRGSAQFPEDLSQVFCLESGLSVDLRYKYATTAEARGINVIIAGAGGAAHLPGMVAALTPLPVNLGAPKPGNLGERGVTRGWFKATQEQNQGRVLFWRGPFVGGGGAGLEETSVWFQKGIDLACLGEGCSKGSQRQHSLSLRVPMLAMGSELRFAICCVPSSASWRAKQAKDYHHFGKGSLRCKQMLHVFTEWAGQCRHSATPRIGVPVKSSALSGNDSLLSIVQMPKGCPCWFEQT